MASLYIDFGYDDNVKRSVNSAKRAIESRKNDYKGIINSINNTSSDTSNLWNANSYIKKKRDQLQDKWDKLDDFRKKIDSFNEFASDKDKAVANRIKKETNQFYKRENIKTGFWYAVGCVISDGWEWVKGQAEKMWDGICTFAKKTWEVIKDFYEKNKYWIDLVVDLVIVVAATAALLASGGFFGVVFAAWGLATAVTDLVFDGAAFKSYYIDGDKETADELREKGMKDVLEYSLGDVGLAIYYGMEVCSFAYDAVDFFKNTAKSIGKVKTKLKTADRVAGYAKTPDKIKGIKSRAIKQCIKEIAFDVIGIKEWDDKGHFAITKNQKILSKKCVIPLFDGFDIPTGIISNVKFGIKTTHTLISSDDSIGQKLTKTFSVSKLAFDIPKTFIEIKDSFTGFASA